MQFSLPWKSLCVAGSMFPGYHCREPVVAQIHGFCCLCRNIVIRYWCRLPSQTNHSTQKMKKECFLNTTIQNNIHIFGTDALSPTLDKQWGTLNMRTMKDRKLSWFHVDIQYLSWRLSDQSNHRKGQKLGWFQQSHFQKSFWFCDNCSNCMLHTYCAVILGVGVGIKSIMHIILGSFPVCTDGTFLAMAGFQDSDFSQEAINWCWDAFWMWFGTFQDSNFNTVPRLSM